MYKVDEHKTEKGGKVLRTSAGHFSIFMHEGEIAVVPIIAGGAPEDTPKPPEPTPPAPPTPGQPGENGITFTPEQQAHINEVIVKGAYSRAYENAGKENLTLQATIADMEAKLKVKSENKDGKVTEDVSLLKNENSNLKTSMAALRTKALRADIQSALSGHDVYSLDQAVSLIAQYVSQDEAGKFIIKSESGIFIDSKGAQGNLKEFVDAYMIKNKNLIKSSDTKGSGGFKPNGSDAVTITRKDFDNKSSDEQSKLALDPSVTIVD